jgi:hypothetical protein
MFDLMGKGYYIYNQVINVEFGVEDILLACIKMLKSMKHPAQSFQGRRGVMVDHSPF